MFGSSQKNGASAYAKIGIETGVIAANPHKLIVMLFDGAITAISNALKNIETNNVAAKGQSISKAIAIIDNGLRASLDKKVGGEVALSLDSLYEYMSRQLLVANLSNDTNLLMEIHSLLKDLKTTWEAIAPIPVSLTEIPRQEYDALAPRPTKFLEA
ncbi:MAG: flagellar export chaperone FliS [Undibacterium sp.]|uniref:flagellar export chaperone FliS n=1 Tax=Undibacterium sp. TaxID=1914977 RepID=UPI0027282105|nr:flagellar export chaperone FliS [Undibacterium sp.]MDO8651598.1 flagellar export chaperone FliS [Undibacterium sp.]